MTERARAISFLLDLSRVKRVLDVSFLCQANVAILVTKLPILRVTGDCINSIKR